MSMRTKREDYPQDAVAIVGMAGRFPESADDLQAFWHNVRDGRSCLRRYSERELLAAGVAPEQVRDPNYVPVGAYLDGIESFDAEYFGFSPREAQITSPHQRMLLECAHDALEHAGYSPKKYSGTIGLYSGVGVSSYFQRNIMSHPDLMQSVGRKTLQFGTDIGFSATHIAYKLNLTGPCVNVTTACSTSLVAIHLACQSLARFECDLALAGASHASVYHDCGYPYVEGGIHARDGVCRAFSEGATGTVSGNGAGIVLLKRLSEALEDGDTIHSLVLGSALNNDGNDKVGFSAPSVDGQAAAIAEAQAIAEVTPDEVSYIEGHGTGTPLGDPIEIAALTKAFRLGTQRRGYCALGSLKATLGHMSVAAGIGGVIKTSLALRHRTLPPTVNVLEPNRQVDWEQSPFYLNDAARPWPGEACDRIAGVSSFGMGGTNAHVVLAEAPRTLASPPVELRKTPRLVCLSATTRDALTNVCANLEGALPESSAPLADIAYTLNMGRTEHSHRACFVATDTHELGAQLAQWRSLGGKSTQAVDAPPLVWVFAGQGAQHTGMASDLYQHDRVVREVLHECAGYLKPLGVDLGALLKASAGELPAGHEQIALFCVQYAMAQRLLSLGLAPAALIGHSLGEYAAAAVSGVFTLEDALTLVVERARLMALMAPGRMVSISLSEIRAKAYVRKGVALAAVNGAERCVLSGSQHEMDVLVDQLRQDGISFKIVNENSGFHSELTDSLLGPFEKVLARITLRHPERPYIANVTGTWADPAMVTTAQYWVTHLRETVRFAPGIGTLEAAGNDYCYVDMGPGNVASALVDGCIGDARRRCVRSMRRANLTIDDRHQLLNALGQLWATGTSVDWTELYAGEKRRRTPLPTYPFQRQRHWIDVREPAQGDTPAPTHMGEGAKAPFGGSGPLYTRAWRQLAPVSVSERGGKVNVLEDRSVLLVMPSGRRRQNLTRVLSGHGARVACVGDGEGFRAIGGRAYEVALDQPSDYERLLQCLKDQGDFPDTVLCATSLAEDCDEGTIGRPAQSCVDLLASAWTVHRVFGAKEVRRLVTLTSGAASVGSPTAARPVGHALAVLSRVSGQEHAGLETNCIDLDPRALDQDHSSTLSTLMAECATSSLPGGVVAVRGRARFESYFQRVDVPAEASPSVAIRRHGTYLITGGLGGVGLSIAGHLVEHYASNLVLVSRGRHVEERAGAFVECRADAEGRDVARTLNRWRELGVRIEVFSADVSDADAVTDCVDKAEARLGPVHGVIHAAGVTGGGLLRTRELRSLNETLAPKLHGALNLLHAFEDREPDFVLLCSSQNAIKGGVARGDYACANATLDGFAAEWNQREDIPFPVIGVNWCAWRDTGMAYRSRASDSDASTVSEIALSNEEGGKALVAALASGCGQVLVSKVDCADLRRDAVREMPHSAGVPDALTPETTEVARAPRPTTLGNPYEAPRSDTETQIAQIWGSLLGVHPVGVTDQYFELGGNSLLLAQLVLGLTQQFGVQVTLQHVLQAQTVAEQAEQVLALRAGDLDLDELETILQEYDLASA